jgi:polyisoprenoid-binding protein YceI
MTTTSPAALAAGHWTVDAARSTATFRVGNLGKEATGTVPVIEGVVDVGADGLPVAISGTLDLSAIDTGIPRRDKDLRQRRFLDLDQHPVMSFTSGPAAATPAGWQVTGQLGVRGTTVTLTGDVEVSPAGTTSARLTARTSLDRRAIGIRAPAFMISRRVDITVTATITHAERERRPPT